ncbi:MAG: GNAT family N-acetyltransferase [Flavobacteriales bacterium]
MNIKISQHIELVAPDAKYVEEFHALIVAEKERLSEWLPWARNYGSIENGYAFEELCRVSFEEKKSFGFTILYNGKAVGKIGTHSVNYVNRRTSIGYWLSETVEGKGVMTQCVKAMVDFCFGELQLNRIEICCAVENEKSNKIPKRLGFTHEGILQQYELLPKGYVDSNIYSMLKKDWK